MLILNKDLADALCVVIACGFFDDMQQPGGTSSNNYTQFINGGAEDSKDPKEVEKAILYQKLNDKLKEFDIKITFSKPAEKDKRPFIMGKGRNTTTEILDGLQNDMKVWSNPLEEKVKRDPHELNGAYLGGYSTTGKAEVIGVSDLYLYRPTYREELPSETLGKAYNNAKTVTNTVIDYLKRMPYFMDVYRDKVQLKEITASYNPGNLFASVHGMTRAITKTPPDSDTSKVYFELALGRDTSKVASCIPCSLFMKAVGVPATYTHLGRGDNWNFPEGFNGDSKDKWTKYIISCYDKGIKKLDGVPLVVEWVNAFNEDVKIKDLIPDIFLEALTYESAFIDKFDNVFKLSEKS